MSTLASERFTPSSSLLEDVRAAQRPGTEQSRHLAGRVRFSRVLAGAALVAHLAMPSVGQDLALSLDGSGSHARIPDSASLDLAGSFTLECWVRVRGGTEYPRLIGKGFACTENGVYEVFVRSSLAWPSSGPLQFPWRLGTEMTNSSPAPSTDCQLLGSTYIGDDHLWRHVAVVADANAGERRLYVNGVLDGVDAWAPTGTNNTDLHIGRNSSNPWDLFAGEIDDLRIWSIARTNADLWATINTRITAGSISAYPGLVSVWNFEGNVSDEAQLNSGTLFGNATFIPADDKPVLTPPAQALELNGSAWVRVADDPALDLADHLTVEAWMRATAFDGSLVDKWGDAGTNDRSYSIEYRAGGQIQFGLARDDNQLDSGFHNFGSGAVPLATWHHVACVYDGVSRKTYVDGLLVGERPTTGLVHAGTTDLSIGAHLRSNAGPVIAPFQGRVDEVRIWSTARTPTEIRRWINETIGPAQVASHPGLVAVWNFDGTTGEATGMHDGVAQGSISYVSSADIPRLYDCDNNGMNDLEEIAANPLIDVNGNNIPDSCECITTNYCIAATNSTGQGARIVIAGVPSVSLNSMTLVCTQLPPNSSGRFFYGPTQIQVPFGNGYRCVGGPTARMPVDYAGPTGTAARSLDLQHPAPGAPTLLAGSTWNFQYWYRNALAGGAGFNLSDGLSVRFCP